ncbi:MAG: kynureninase [Phycisphaerales bacterium]|nr:kynureninase [Phycisphaerales bacterium]
MPAAGEPVADIPFAATEACARALDAADPLSRYRERFCIPRSHGGAADGSPAIYFCGNSLGLMPRATRAAVLQELEDWERLGVEGHFKGRHPWYPAHEALREPGARLVGALPHEVVFMNGLTVNLHLLMVSFYRPTSERFAILVEDAAFPSDTYALQTQIRFHGRDPADALIRLAPRAGEHTLRTEDILERIERSGPQLALVMLGGVNFLTGQAFDMPAIAAAAQRVGARVGFDLAHAAGNIELQLHDWNVDFAAWCTYKYLNSGPGAVAGAFVHERHVGDAGLPRFGGWWGNDPATRFRMHLERGFVPVASADAWQLSNPPVLALAPVRVSLGVFYEAGMPALAAKSRRLSGYLRFLLDAMPSGRYEVITPRETPDAGRPDSPRPVCGAPLSILARERPDSPRPVCGAQISILVRERPRELFSALEAAGVVCDFREPNVIRVAPVPLYNTFYEVWRFAEVLRGHTV